MSRILGSSYLHFCDERKDQDREHFNRMRGAVPMCGHHIDPDGGGDKDDWDHPNIVPLTPSENFTAHMLRFMDNPDSEEEAEEIRRMSDGGRFSTAEQFEEYVIRMYDLGHVTRC
jgi:hypothetical protein